MRTSLGNSIKIISNKTKEKWVLAGSSEQRRFCRIVEVPIEACFSTKGRCTSPWRKKRMLIGNKDNGGIYKIKRS